ncbi:MAG: glycoside hydrolase family 66 protein, partial [Muribaculaceae bacterium]|nr:glycoside hydrolase family 66 protein [Muribaculaceae bacterium]
VIDWPPTQTVPMTAVDGNEFHLATIDLAGGTTHFSVADYAGGGDPSCKAPAGHFSFALNRNGYYSLPADFSKVDGAAPARTVVSASTTGEFDLWTDKARYNPGDEVWIQASKFNQLQGARVRYRRGADVVREHPLVQEWWGWTPPADDFQGYLVDVYTVDADGNEHIHGSIGVDVSSAWKRFPRYGYTAWYDADRLDNIYGDVAFLNRRHINAVQFQDWHNSHHCPWGGEQGWKDIANRDISVPVVRKLIEANHAYNMKSYFYNLGFGALERDWAAAQGVKEEWYYYKDRNHSQKDYHNLPDSWKSSITFVDPGNRDWLAYLCGRNQDVYASLDFDGFQVDQVGHRGDTYDYWGNQIWLDQRFPDMLKAFKAAHPAKGLIMNSVSKYGLTQIASTGVVDVAYNECWASEPLFTDLYDIIAENNRASGNSIKTVFANYMNYDYADTNWGSTFNTPGVLLTDACIFALGAGHLELGTGYNMLSREYFPAQNLRMTDELVEAITRYYDFATAYETHLYDTARELSPTINSLDGYQLSVWSSWRGPQPRRIVVHAKASDKGDYVYHLLNFRSADSLSWRDLQCTQPEPEQVGNLRLSIDVDRMVSRAWVASPDSNACVPVEIPFTQEGNSVVLTVPSLKYWTMLVLE